MKTYDQLSHQEKSQVHYRFGPADAESYVYAFDWLNHKLTRREKPAAAAKTEVSQLGNCEVTIPPISETNWGLRIAMGDITGSGIPGGLDGNFQTLL